MNPLQLGRLYLRARRAARYGTTHPFPGLVFDQFGRQLGRSLLLRGKETGIGYVINPVSLIRYFEFVFALNCLPDHPGDCLDVSSPRLFSYYVAANHPRAAIRMINPHAADIDHSARVVEAMGWRNVTTACAGVELLEREPRQYDTIWSISVVEHISGEYDDSRALRLMYEHLKPGGRLIVTTMADRRFWDEYRDDDHYTTQPDAVAGKHFFQRWYDEAALEQRIYGPLGVRPSRIEWCGEIQPGRFREYERRWTDGGGWDVTVDDVREFQEHYRLFDSWSALPGIGIVGLLFEKPLT